MTDTEDTDVDLKHSTTTTKEKEVLVVRDRGVFKHDTGDTYDGFFEVKKKDGIFRMFGAGTYKTNEGDTYTGMWESDRPTLNDEMTITYHDGHRYEGFIKDWCYSGHGKYFYPDESVVSCSFVENCPIGVMTLMDPNGHTWTATAGMGCAWFEPVNHYYDLLAFEKLTLPAKMRRGSKQSKGDAVVEPSPPPTVETTPKKSKKK